MSEDQAPQARLAQLARLRGQGAWRLDPVRFDTLEALGRRLSGQAPAVQALLADRLQAGLDEFEQRLAALPPAAGRGGSRKVATPSPCEPLAQLNAYIRQASPAAQAAASGPVPTQAELASVRRFRQAWSRGRAQDRVSQASTRRPAKAGPLNSHTLVLDSLALMDELSPDYLRRFLAQVESLQWLEQARERLPAQTKAAPAAKGARRGRGKK